MGWFFFILFIIITGIIVYLLINQDARERAIAHINQESHQKKESRKKQIIERLRQDKKITNDDVQALFGVSHSTATRYFDELQEEGKIEESGEGRGTFYVLKKG